MEIVNWLNNNQGAAIAVLTMVYVIATIGIAVLMLRANSLTRKSLKQSEETEKERSRPNVIFDFFIDGSCVFAELRNEGLTSAKNISINLTPNLVEEQRGKACAFTQKRISFLAPGKKLRDFIATGPVFFKDENPLKYQCHLSYESSLGDKYSEIIDLDMTFNKKSSFSEEYHQKLDTIFDKLVNELS